MFPILIRIPGLGAEGIPIYGFGLMLFIAFILCTWLAGQRAKVRGIAPALVQDMSVWIFISGLAGARTLYLYEQKLSFTEFLWNFPRIWDGGIILYGSAAGGLAGFLIFWWFNLRPKKIEPLLLLDIITPSVALGIALGRIGCLLNGCCFGLMTEPSQPTIAIRFPLSAPARHDLVHAGLQTALGFTLGNQTEPGVVVGKVIPDSSAQKMGIQPGDRITHIEGKPVANAYELAMILSGNWPRGKENVKLTVVRMGEVTLHPEGAPLHPAQIYETISMLLLLFLLLSVEPFQARIGQLTSLLMMAYALHRFLNEQLRSDPRPVSLESNVSVFLFLAGALLLLWVQWRGKKIQPAFVPQQEAKPA